jgi:hypothetical protein
MAETGAAHHFEKHEPGGITVWTVILIAAGFLLFVAVSLAALYFYYAWSTRAVAPPEPRSFPKPALEATPLLDLQTLQDRQRGQLSGYAWVDRDHGIARIPMERAMKIIAARGAGAYGSITIENTPSNAPAAKRAGPAHAKAGPAPSAQGNGPSTRPAPASTEGHP